MIILYFSCPFLAKPPRKRTHDRTEGLRHGSKLEYSILIFVLVPEEVSTVPLIQDLVLQLYVYTNCMV